MKPQERIIIALDASSIEEAASLADEIGPVGALKVGLELITSCGAPQVVKEISKRGRIFFDAKFKDIPNTVLGAARAAVRMGVWMFNVHALGGLEMMRSARAGAEEEAKKLNAPKPLIIAVTVLTSLDKDSLGEIGFGSIKTADEIKGLAVRLALLAKKAGLDGVVASPDEIEPIKKACGEDFLVVAPGVRPKWAASNDQKRITTPAEAINRGADFIVIGRPVTRPPTGGPKSALERILEEIKI